MQKNSKKVKNNTQITINYSNPVLNKINVTKIINDKFCHFPLQDHKISHTFKYPETLGRTIFNYNNFSKYSSSQTFSCHCNAAHLKKKIINSDHDHIITSDLNIIQSNKLKQLMKFSAKFRIPSKTNINAILKQFIYDLDLTIYKI